jgi:hypothetical protein
VFKLVLLALHTTLVTFVEVLNAHCSKMNGCLTVWALDKPSGINSKVVWLNWVRSERVACLGCCQTLTISGIIVTSAERCTERCPGIDVRRVDLGHVWISSSTNVKLWYVDVSYKTPIVLIHTKWLICDHQTHQKPDIEGTSKNFLSPWTGD